jgi:hypothetical protein
LPCAMENAPLCRAPENMCTAKIETHGNHRFSGSDFVHIIKFVVQQINIRHSYIVYMAPDIPNFGYPTCSRDTFDQNNIARISPIIQKARHMCHMPSPR